MSVDETRMTKATCSKDCFCLGAIQGADVIPIHIRDPWLDLQISNGIVPKT